MISKAILHVLGAQLYDVCVFWHLLKHSKIEY